MEKVFLGTILLMLVVSIYVVRKDSFYNLEKENKDDYTNYYRPAAVFTNQVVPAQKNEKTSKTELATLFREIITYANGAPGGANVNVAQNKYDLIFKDILVCSDKRNHEKYPNPNNYYVNLNVKLDKVYKAELIDVYIPAATDEAVNISTTGNRLYFSYINKPPKRCKKCKDTSGCVPKDKTVSNQDCSGCNCAQKKKEPPRVDGFITIQAGTYTSPDAIAREITRQFNIVLSGVGIKVDQTTGITVNYDKNLNRYNIRDRQICRVGTVILYTKNGYVLSPYSSVTNSIGASMMLFDEVYISGPKETHLVNETLVVENAVPGDYGKVNGWNVPLNTDCQFSNCILSDVVLTHCKLYLSLGKLNGDTCTITPDENIISKKNVPPIFCQVPNNTCVSSAAVKTLLNQPHMFSAIQFYNPPISKVNKFEVKWYTDDGSLVRILDHCFTIRIYYFQKRIDTTDFSFPVP
jgi:hypothetical protein